MTMHLETLAVPIETSAGTVLGRGTQRLLGQYEPYLETVTALTSNTAHPIDAYSPLVDAAKQVVEKVYQPEACNQNALAALGRYGETIIASEALSSMGVHGLKHYIFWANGRSGLAIPAPGPHGSKGLYLFSADIGLEPGPGWQGRKRAPNLADNLMGRTVLELTADLETTARTVATVDMSGLPHQSPLKSARYQPAIMSLFPATQGRQTLVNYSGFLTATHSQNPETAYRHLEQAQQHWARADARGSHRTISRLVAQLIAKSTNKARHAAEMYCNAFPETPDIQRLHTKLQRQIQRTSSSPVQLPSAQSRQLMAA